MYLTPVVWGENGGELLTFSKDEQTIFYCPKSRPVFGLEERAVHFLVGHQLHITIALPLSNCFY